MDITQDLAAERRAHLAFERTFEQIRSEPYDNEADMLRNVEARSARVSVPLQLMQDSLISPEGATSIAERRLWDSLESIRDGFAVFDPNDILITANRAYLSVFDGLEMVRPGIALADLFLLLAEEGIVDTGGLKAVAWQESMLKRFSRARIDPTILKIWNGTYIKLIDRRTREGDLVTLGLNITDQIEREKELKETSLRAEAANRAKSAFLANMSHEIRTPMSGIIGMADLLVDTALNEEQRTYIETIRSSGEALLVIINDVLDYSKIEAEKYCLKSGPFDLEQCIHDVVTLLSPSATEKGIQIAVDYDLFMPTSYVGDAGRIRQVLTNLVGNAIKFTAEGHIAIQVVGLPVEDDGNYRIHLTVEDTGIGIPSEKLDDIFREFHQVENDRDRAHDGTGLGLAISSRLIELMGGDIWVDSKEGSGSVFGFQIVLPVVADVEPEEISTPGWMDRAIVLDREGLNRSILIKQLSIIGLHAVVVSSLEELSELRPTADDLVFLGVDSEDQAQEAARTIRSRYSPAAVFRLSDLPSQISEGEAVFDGVLQRPVLRAAMSKCLRPVSRPIEPLHEALDVPRARDETAILEMPRVNADNIFDAAFNLSDTEFDLADFPTSIASNDGVTDSRLTRVLVAEDNRVNRMVIAKMLQNLNIDLAFAENGQEALDHFQWQRPDILFTDISMPKMDGKEAARRIRTLEEETGAPRCPIIAITAHAMDGDAEEILAAGIDHYLTKPVRKAALIEHIQRFRPAVAQSLQKESGGQAAAASLR